MRPEAIDEFREMAGVPVVADTTVESLRDADEEHQLEPALMRILGEVDVTPHGPTEEADIVTVHLRVEGRPGFAALVLKGKAWKSVKRRDVTHQLVSAVQLPNVELVVLAAVGDIQDDAKRDLVFLADARGVDWMLLDRGDLARLLSAYREWCPNDGRWLAGEPCPDCGFGSRPPRRRRPRFEVLTLEDVSSALAKRYKAHILVPPDLDETDIESRIRDAVDMLRREHYARSEQLERAHAGRQADVVFLFVYEDITDRPYANWICRAIWVSPGLDERWRPVGFGKPTSDPHLRIDWSTMHGAIAQNISDRQPKGTYLRALDSYLGAVPELVGQVREALGRGVIDADADRRLQRLASRIDVIPRPDRSKAPPHELTQLDELFETVEGDVATLTLAFGPLGLQTWPDVAPRARIARDALNELANDLPRLVDARKRIR